MTIIVNLEAYVIHFDANIIWMFCLLNQENYSVIIYIYCSFLLLFSGIKGGNIDIRVMLSNVNRRWIFIYLSDHARTTLSIWVLVPYMFDDFKFIRWSFLQNLHANN